MLYISYFINNICLFYSVHTFHLARDSTSTPDRSESLLFRPSSSSSLRSSRRSSKATGVERSTLSNYIRMFEPMVIRALKVSFFIDILDCESADYENGDQFDSRWQHYREPSWRVSWAATKNFENFLFFQAILN